MKPSTKIIIGIILIFLILVIFNIIGRITERKVWSEPKQIVIPEILKAPIDTPITQDTWCVLHDCKG